jgi:3alpha(or 20beta)-hydroxysteroid dehydrogenase
MGRLEGRVAIITGGARGVGAAVTRLFAAEGASIVIADMLVNEGEALAGELGDRVIFIRTDVSCKQDWKTLLEQTTLQFGSPDILVNNAAIQRFSSILDCDEDEFRRLLDVNLIGTFLGLSVVGREMVCARRGAIVNVSSVDGMRGANGYAAYSTSKWGVRGLSKVAAMEFGPRGVRVNSVHPGGVYTAMGNPVGASVEEFDKGFGMAPLQRSGRVNEIAMAILYLASEEASYVCGAELVVDGGWTAGVFNPGLSGAPEDAEYGLRGTMNELSVQLNDALSGTQSERR